MENKQRQILSEINEMSASIRSQLDILERKILELDQLLGVEAQEKPIEVDLDAIELPVADLERLTDIPVAEAPEEDLPAAEEVAETPEAAAEEPAEEASVEPVEEVAEEVPAETVEAPVEEAAAEEDLSEAESEAEPEAEPEATPVEAPEEVEAPAEVEEQDTLILEPEIERPVAEPKHVVAQKIAVIDAMAEHQLWRTAIPGSTVRDIRSALSLNDRLLFINSLFNHDAVLFQNTMCALNAMETLDEAVEYLAHNNPDWDFESDEVYRFMMAVRRKLK